MIRARWTRHLVSPAVVEEDCIVFEPKEPFLDQSLFALADMGFRGIICLNHACRRVPDKLHELLRIAVPLHGGTPAENPFVTGLVAEWGCGMYINRRATTLPHYRQVPFYIVEPGAMTEALSLFLEGEERKGRKVYLPWNRLN